MFKPKNICLCLLKFPLTSFPSEEYRQDILVDERLIVSIELLVPSIDFKISWEQALIQSKSIETRKDSQPCESRKFS